MDPKMEEPANGRELHWTWPPEQDGTSILIPPIRYQVEAYVPQAYSLASLSFVFGRLQESLPTQAQLSEDQSD